MYPAPGVLWAVLAWCDSLPFVSEHCKEAWQVLQRLLALKDLPLSDQLDLFNGATSHAAEFAPEQRDDLLRRIRLHRLRHNAVGGAWGELAYEQLEAGKMDAARASWRKALRYSPPASPWAKIIVDQVLVADPLAGVTPWQVLPGPAPELPEMVRDVAAMVDAYEGGPPQRLLAQAHVLVGNVDHARFILRRLRSEVSPERASPKSSRNVIPSGVKGRACYDCCLVLSFGWACFTGKPSELTVRPLVAAPAKSACQALPPGAPLNSHSRAMRLPQAVGFKHTLCPYIF